VASRTFGPGPEEPGAGRGGRALRNGAPQTGSGPDGSSPQRTALCAAGNLTVAPGTRIARPSRPQFGARRGRNLEHGTVG